MKQPTQSPHPFISLLVVVPAILAGALLTSCGSGGSLAVDAGGGVVRVSLADPLPSIDITSAGGVVIESLEGAKTWANAHRVSCVIAGPGAVECTVDANAPVLLRGMVKVCPLAADTRLGFRGMTYPDTLTVVPEGPGLRLVNSLPLETYLEGVVPNEIGPDRSEAEFAAVQAQAVIARSYALMKIRSPLTRMFDVYADTRDQVYKGTSSWSALASRAVRETRGLVVASAGRVAECYYHSTCGGKTEAVSLVWSRPQSKPYLCGVTDSDGDGDYCRDAPSYRWSETYSRKELEEMFRTTLASANDEIGRIPAGPWYLYDMKIIDRHPSGRVATLKIWMGNGDRKSSYTVRGDRVRWAIRRPGSAGILRSAMFDIAMERDETKWITRVRIDGAGNGHGIGLCQWGAIGRARKGQDFRTILGAYYPGTDVRRITDLEFTLADGAP